MPAVSIIIPAYNRADYLPVCLESIFAQTFRDYEIIIADDGSADNTRELLDPLIREQKIRYISQENKGPGAARNNGLSQATGELIAFLDSDDLWPPDKLEWQVQYLKDHPEVGVIGGGFHWIDQSGSKTGQPVLREGPASFEGMFEGPPFVSPGETLIRRRVLEEAGGFDEARSTWPAEDMDLWLRLVRMTPIMSLPRVALYYRRHPSNSSRSALLMYLTCRRVLDRHMAFVSPQSRSAVRLSSMRWLYRYRGVTAIREWKAQLLRGDWHDSWKYTMALGWFLRGALGDRGFFVSIFKEMLPARFASQCASQGANG
jgi:glycosyltransferase involved in cell wall biosynthesis